MVARVYSEDNNMQLEATTRFSKLLSIERSPPIEEVILLDVVSRFLQFLTRDDFSPTLENGSGSFSAVMGDIVADIGHQLHAGIMKSTRKALIDEIFSCVLPEVIACRKTEKQLAATLKTKPVKVCSKLPARKIRDQDCRQRPPPPALTEEVRCRCGSVRCSEGRCPVASGDSPKRSTQCNISLTRA